jgi:hypothetical protein
LPAHGSSGVQHVWLAVQMAALGHVAEHVTVWPQTFVTVVLQWSPHAVTGSGGVQHVLPSHTSVGDEQFTVPPAPHGIVCPQLLGVEPHVLFAHVVVTGSGTQPHEPPLHVRPASQPPHMIVCPQSSTVGPQRFWQYTEGGVGEQHVLFAVHTSVPGHAGGQGIISPQEFVTVTPHLPAHACASFGVQHVPSGLHTSELEAHDAVPPAPQATAWPQLFVVVPQLRPAHVVVGASGTQPSFAGEASAGFEPSAASEAGASEGSASTTGASATGASESRASTIATSEMGASGRGASYAVASGDGAASSVALASRLDAAASASGSDVALDPVQAGRIAARSKVPVRYGAGSRRTDRLMAGRSSNRCARRPDAEIS